MPACERILFVDDDLNLLTAMRRQLRSMFEMEIGVGGQEGLRVLRASGPFAVIVADMKMPGMDGIEFLSRAKTEAPHTVRMMLTGQADVETAMRAVNDGSIFRFMTKPCAEDILTTALEHGLEQYRLITAERELIEKTLSGSVWVLSEILSLVNPVAFGRTVRIKEYVKTVVNKLKLEDGWRYQLAAMLSQVGTVTLPPVLLEKVAAGEELTSEEEQMYSCHPAAGARLVAEIPRLEPIADMIQGQDTGSLEGFKSVAAPRDKGDALRGAGILKTAVDLDRLVSHGTDIDDALQNMRMDPSVYDPELLDALTPEKEDLAKMEARFLTVEELDTTMIANQNIVAKNGVLLVPNGQQMTSAVLTRLGNFVVGAGVQEPFSVRVPVQKTRPTAA